MEVIVSARHMSKVPPSMKSEAEDLLARITEKYPKLTKAEVVMDKTKKGCFAEVVLHGKGIDMEARSLETTNLYDAVHQAVERLEKQLSKKHGRRKRHNSQHLGDLEVEILSISHEMTEYELEVEEYEEAQ
jgi:ribosomal subunit interface protein